MNPTDWVRKYRQLYYGWKVLPAAWGMLILAGGIHQHGFNIFILPIKEGLALTSAQAALVFSLARAEGGAEGPIAGWLIDRYGTRRLLIGGILLSAAGYYLLSFVNSFLGFTLVYLGLVTLGSSVAFQHALLANLNMWFIRYRATVISVATSGLSFGGAILVPLMTLIVLRTDWKVGAIIAGTLYMTMMLPLSLVIRPSPESMGLLPDGDSSPGQAARSPGGVAAKRRGTSSSVAAGEVEYRVKEALQTRAFWLLLLGGAFRQTGRAAIMVNLVPIFFSRVPDQQLAANLVGLLLVASIVGRLPVGVIADRMSKEAVLIVAMALEAGAFVFLLVGESTSFLYAYVIMSGLGEGAWVISWVLLGDYFGRRNFASLRGIITFSYSGGIVAAPAFAGWIFDNTGSWDIPLIFGMALLVMSTLTFAMMRRPLLVAPVPANPYPAEPLEGGK